MYSRNLNINTQNYHTTITHSRLLSRHNLIDQCLSSRASLLGRLGRLTSLPLSSSKSSSLGKNAVETDRIRLSLGGLLAESTLGTTSRRLLLGRLLLGNRSARIGKDDLDEISLALRSPDIWKQCEYN